MPNCLRDHVCLLIFFLHLGNYVGLIFVSVFLCLSKRNITDNSGTYPQNSATGAS